MILRVVSFNKIYCPFPISILHNLLRIPKRKTAKMGLKKYPKKSKLSKSPICEALKSYNELPEKVKVKDKEKFKSTVNKYYKTNYKLEPG